MLRNIITPLKHSMKLDLKVLKTESLEDTFHVDLEPINLETPTIIAVLD